MLILVCDCLFPSSSHLPIIVLIILQDYQQGKIRSAKWSRLSTVFFPSIPVTLFYSGKLTFIGYFTSVCFSIWVYFLELTLICMALKK